MKKILLFVVSFVLFNPYAWATIDSKDNVDTYELLNYV